MYERDYPERNTTKSDLIGCSLKVLGAPLHIWTIWLAYQMFGGFWAFVAFFAPGAAECVMFGIATLGNGAWISVYALMCYAYIALGLVWYAVIFLEIRLWESKRNAIIENHVILHGAEVAAKDHGYDHEQQ